MAAILLAAGFGRRFGAQKLLAQLPDGRAIAVAAAKNLLDAGERVLAVTGGDLALDQALLDAGCEILHNPRAGEGMGTSIAAGIAAAGEPPWLVALADMPYVRAGTIAAIAAAARDHAIVVPVFEGLRGHPVAFNGRFRDELMALAGDQGARAILSAHADRVHALAVEDPGVLADIDTRGDLASSTVTE